MRAGVVLDTSFLITLSDAARPHHALAQQYWRHFKEVNTHMFLPTIVISEFCLRMPIPSHIRLSCLILPFNVDDAMEAAKLDFTRMKPDGDGSTRQGIKDDVKIMAQAIKCNAQFIITEDANFCKRGRQLVTEGSAKFTMISLHERFFPSKQAELFQ